MPEVNEKNSSSTADPKPEDPKDKKPLKIRIHLLCDGTANNKTNIAEREKYEASQPSDSLAYLTHGAGGTSSYDNGRTNIAIMEPHVEDGKKKNGYEMVVKVYVEGQGTQQLRGDDMQGLVFGAGLTGVYHRAREGINTALNILQTELFKENSPEDFFIKQVDVDVFGFSRGAATARHAIHAILTEETMSITDPNGYPTETIVITHPLFQRLRLLGYTETRADQIKIKFAGLYDTVVSVNGSQLAPAWMANNTRDQRAVAKAEFALHLAAVDEHREDFPLHTIASSIKAGKGAEYYLPGVHSDVGGSYNQANEYLLDNQIKDATIRQISESGKVYSERKIQGLEYARTSDEVGRIINYGRVSDLEEDRKHLMDAGWYKEEQIWIETDYLATAAKAGNLIGMLINGSPVSGKLITTRIGIKSAYSNIPLKIMVKHARDWGLQIKSKLDERADITLATEPDLQELKKDIDAYMAKKGKTGSKPDDWLNVNTAKAHHSNIKKIRNEHMHMSSRTDALIKDFGYTPRIKNNLRRRFYYEG
jgi:hypothetical protein